MWGKARLFPYVAGFVHFLLSAKKLRHVWSLGKGCYVGFAAPVIFSIAPQWTHWLNWRRQPKEEKGIIWFFPEEPAYSW